MLYLSWHRGVVISIAGFSLDDRKEPGVWLDDGWAAENVAVGLSAIIRGARSGIQLQI